MNVRSQRDPAVEAALDTFIKLVRATETIGVRLHRELGAIGLTASQFGVLELLYHHGPLVPLQIERKILKSAEAKVGTVIAQLIRRGLVQREAQPGALGARRIALTEEAECLVREVFPAHSHRITALMSAGLSPAEMSALGALCRKLGRAIEAGEVVEDC